MTRCVFLLAMVIGTAGHAQVDPAKLDSLAKQIESTHRSTTSYQDSFMKAGDSTYRAGLGKAQEGPVNPDTSVIAERKEERNESKNYVRTGIAALLLVLLVIGLLWIRKKSHRS